MIKSEYYLKYIVLYYQKKNEMDYKLKSVQK